MQNLFAYPYGDINAATEHLVVPYSFWIFLQTRIV
jgi:hypothetical protein